MSTCVTVFFSVSGFPNSINVEQETVDLSNHKQKVFTTEVFKKCYTWPSGQSTVPFQSRRSCPVRNSNGTKGR